MCRLQATHYRFEMINSIARNIQEFVFIMIILIEITLSSFLTFHALTVH